jgi:uncharacterized protein
MTESNASPSHHDRRANRSLNTLLRDAHFLCALAAGPIVWLMLAWWSNASPVIDTPLRLLVEEPHRFAMLVIAYPIVEEFIFRGWLQPALHARFRHFVACGVSAANIITSACFAMLHLWSHPPAMALATFFPSLVFGHFAERYGRLLPAILLHIFYNAGYFCLFG